MTQQFNTKWVSISVLATLILSGIIYMANFHHDSVIFKFLGYIPMADKILHFSLIGGLAYLVNKALNGKRIKLFRFQFLLGSFAVTIFALLEELSQGFIPSRNLDAIDLLFTFAGIWFFSRNIQPK